MVNVLNAVKIEQEQFNDNEVDEIEVEGFVTSVTSATNFSVNNMPVQVDSNTVYDGGVAVDVVEGVFIEVEGMLVNSVLIADEVEFGDAVRIEAEVANVGIDTMTLVGLDGIIIQTNSFTEFNGDSITDLTDFVPGNVVKVRGYPLSNNTTVIARQLELTSASGGNGTDVSLRGPVTVVNAMSSTFGLLGFSVGTIGFADNDFEQNDLAIGSASFYSTISVGSIVEVTGRLDAGMVTWQKVEIED
jgi:hypothetical protein